MSSINFERYKVSHDQLRRICSTDNFNFRCTSDIEPIKEFIGQERAISSIDFGLAVERPGYNLFLTGLTGTGKASTIEERLRQFIREKKNSGWTYEVNDWCYVHNFAEPDHPRILKLQQGQGKIFSSEMEQLLKTLKHEIPKTFGSEEFTKQKQTITEEHQKKYQESVSALEQEAKEKDLMVQIYQGGANVIPVRDDKPMSREEFMKLPEEEREDIESKRLEMLKKVEETYAHMKNIEKDVREKMKQIEMKAGEFAISGPFEELLKKYNDFPNVIQFLKEAREHTLDKLELFVQPQSEKQMSQIGSPIQVDPYNVYRVNVFVDNSNQEIPPIVVEQNPHWFNLFGKIERKALMGTYMSDHMMIKPGAVQMANSGYLILNVRDVLLNPGSWEGLKRVIKGKEAKTEDPGQQFGFFLPQGMRPEAMPVDLKLIMLGNDYLYHMLMTYEEDFWEMFKVKADFDYQMDRTDDNLKSYTCFIRKCCDEEKLLPFDSSGVAKVLEYASRSVSHKDKLSARFGLLKDVLIEADYWARNQSSREISGYHVEKAIREKIYRLDLIAERIRQLIAEGTLIVDIEGIAIGQVNGLSVYDLGIISFGRPSRITAKTFLGKRGVINIERESQLSGHIHDKGVLILSGYLGWKYARKHPLSLSASICFEQMYSGVEGDSASSTELYAILSSLADLPLRQDIAVTGSVNQKGEIQPIGGVNEKIEGFYDICKIKGLTGNQGVIIPQRNIKNLMVREDVVHDVRQGNFHIYSVETIDQGIEILTGIPAGDEQEDGSYPHGSVNYLVDDCLSRYAETMKTYYFPDKID